MINTTMLAIIIPITIALVQVIKLTGITERFLPLCSVAVGILIAYVSSLVGMTGGILLTGIVAGVSASGLYDHRVLFQK